LEQKARHSSASGWKSKSFIKKFLKFPEGLIIGTHSGSSLEEFLPREAKSANSISA